MRQSFIEQMLPTLVDEAPEGDDSIHEIEHDSYRTQLVVENGKAKAFPRRGADWTAKDGPLVHAAAEVSAKIVVLDSASKSSSHGFRKGSKAALADWC
jgi:bifunctional non-homologous end joining protein LigD